MGDDAWPSRRLVKDRGLDRGTNTAGGSTGVCSSLRRSASAAVLAIRCSARGHRRTGGYMPPVSYTSGSSTKSRNTSMLACLAAAACLAQAGAAVVSYSRERSLLTLYVYPDRNVRRQSYEERKILNTCVVTSRIFFQRSMYKVIEQEIVVLSIREVETFVLRVCEVVFFNSAYTK